MPWRATRYRDERTAIALSADVTTYVFVVARHIHER